jgi:GTPase
MTNNKCDFISVVGAPNAGKSTLINKLIGSKVCITSPKIQTTRTVIKAIFVEGNTQLVFMDTPGIFVKAKRKLEKAILQEAIDNLIASEQIIFIIDVTKPFNNDVEKIIDILKKYNKKVIFVLNKVDLIKPEKMLPVIQKLQEYTLEKEFFFVSAETGENVELLKKYLIDNAPKGEFAFDPEQITDVPSKFLAAEITREKLFHAMHQEIPYNLSVETESWKTDSENITEIHQVIYINRASHKAMILGKKGENLKKIGTQSRYELQEIFGTKMRLFLFIKLREDWLETENMYEHMGLKFPK